MKTRFRRVARTAVYGLVVCTAAAQTITHPDLQLQTVVSGFSLPTGIGFLGPQDFLVTEKNTGMVKWVSHGAIQGTVLDLAVNNSSERGLLSIAVHPKFKQNPYVYLFWTCQAPPAPAPAITPTQEECADTPATGLDSEEILAVPLRGNRVDRFVWNGNTLTFDRNIITLRTFQNDGVPLPPGQDDAGQPARGNHDGGVVEFGPDGKLYIISGDLGRRGQMQNLANGPTPETTSDDDDQFGGPEPDENHMSGIVLRLNDDGSTPTDNPFYAAGAAIGGQAGQNVQRIFAYGIRNSFGLAFDPSTGNLWETEHGDDAFDEINRIAAGHNGGWIQFMGPANRIADFKEIELTLPPSGGDSRGGLQQFRWPPTKIADSTAEGLSRLFMLPGAHYADPQYSWKFATLPVGLSFFTPRFGPDLRGNLLVNLASGPGFLLSFPLSQDRLSLATADKVDDNMAKQQLNESIPFVIGSGFGIVTDIEISPNNTLFLVGHFSGTVYELK